MKDHRQLLETFTSKHVRRDFRERFIHEAFKKPGKLQSRIFHRIHDVFADSYRDRTCPFGPDEICIPITGTGVDSFEKYRWAEIQGKATPGFGLLVISSDGSRFYAETEHDYRCPSIVYSSAK